MVRWLDGVPPAARRPIVLLTLIYFLDQFDTATANLFAPEIQHSFHIANSTFVAVSILNVAIPFLLGVPIGYLGDRLPRVPIVVASAFVAGLFSFLTGLSLLLGFTAFVVFRVLNGFGQLVNDPVHNSLITDYVEPAGRPKAFSFHSSALATAGLCSPLLVGGVGTVVGWPATFCLMSLPVFVVALRSRNLIEPPRGGSELAVGVQGSGVQGSGVQGSGDGAGGDGPAPTVDRPRIRDVYREIRAVRTLRYQYVAWMFVGAGYFPIIALQHIYLKQVFGIGPLERGVIGTLGAAALLVGFVVSARMTTASQERDVRGPLTLTAAALITVSAFAGFIALAPSAPAPFGLLLTAAALTGSSFLVGFFIPAFQTGISQVAPVRARTSAYAGLGIALVLGVVLLYYGTGAQQLSDHGLIRYGFAECGVPLLIGGLILLSARRFVAADHARVRVQTGEEAGPDPDVLLEVRGVSAGYGPVQILFGVDLQVRRGEIVALLGTNGAGKSTLLKAVTGLLPPTAGTVFLDGHDITRLDAVSIARRGVVQVPGGKAVFPGLTVAEHFTAGTWLMPRADARQTSDRVEAVLDRFPRLRERWEQKAGNLSGGEQQMLALGMAFVARPSFLVIDELSLGLAPAIVEQLLDMVRAIHADGCSVVVVEQSVNVALTIADRAYFLEKGEVRFEGATSELLERPDVLHSVFLAGAVAGMASGQRAAVVREPDRPARAIDAQPWALEASGLVKSFGGVHAVRDVGFAVRPGRTVGFVGANGAGKTTVFDLLSGILDLDAGQIRLDGVDVTAWPGHRRAAAGLGRSFQDAKIFPSLTVAENLAIGFERHLPVRDHAASALALPAVQASELELAFSVADLVELMQLDEHRDKPVATLSTGQRRIVDLAMALAHDPTVLLLDEPSSGIAQRETEALAPLLRQVQAETGCAMLVIEHDMPLLREVSDEVVALELGAVLLQADAETVLTDPRVVASYLGGDPAAVQRSGRSARRPPRPREPVPR